ncbi:DUF3225 domain-containing protein [Nakamurella sp. YIM 132087]|uniref:DUF3225 domain-containing protein n=1 Tax=Nakamurella alba TaxID=2665158 RepID=A0A7K1FJI9_9ACTN|nr:AtzH-like domain-containing protein [Nakamurella alba]MTD14302.1 DUF3225 domain-containing protein [Nakamurella alba]
MTPIDPADAVPDGLLEAFRAYERALMTDDIDAMDSLFAAGPETLRGDRGGLLVGHEAIAAFRRGRGGAPARTLGDLHVQVVDADTALIMVVTLAASGGRGLQTQLWRRIDGTWQVTAAQVGPPPQTFDPTVWRVVGDPLVAGAESGPLAGEGIAVKDVFAVAGHQVGAGVPAYLAGSPLAETSAAAVGLLLAAGASVRGIARTDQFAYSIAGTNEHYGAPVNPVVTGAVPGGSTSGSATAVSLGAAKIGLGTDTAGSIRVPASYQGLWGLRTTHGSVPTDGLLALAPDFDTVGLLTRDSELLRRAAAVLVPSATAGCGGLVMDPAVIARASADVAAAVAAAVDGLGTRNTVDLGDLEKAYEAFRVHQAFQAWQVHGEWITSHPGALKGAAAGRFEIAAAVTVEQDAAARQVLAGARSRWDEALGDGVLVLPSAASAPPLLTDPPEAVDRVRAATLTLTCVAGITGRPAVSVPGLTVEGGPVGLCLVGPRGSDLALLDRAAALAATRP